MNLLVKLIFTAGFAAIARCTGAGAGLFLAAFVARLFKVPARTHFLDNSLAVKKLLESAESFFNGLAAAEFYFTGCTGHIFKHPLMRV